MTIPRLNIIRVTRHVLMSEEQERRRRCDGESKFWNRMSIKKAMIFYFF